MLDFDRQVDNFCRISKLEDERKNAAKTDLQNLFVYFSLLGEL